MEMIAAAREDSMGMRNLAFTRTDLLPSIMPPPDSTLRHPPPSASRPFPLPTKLERSYLEHLDASGRVDTVKNWRRHVEVEPERRGLDAPSPGRNALSSVNLNAGSASAVQYPHAGPSKHAYALPPRLAAAIPRPAAQPDVFAAEPSIRIPNRFNENFAQIQRPKRARETSNQSLAKRPRVDQAAAAENARARKAEEEKWTAKWVKVFPTLVFYFEAGADDGSGRVLKQRVAKMGASVDQFFSQKVSHLIVKGSTGSPQKAKPLGNSRRVNEVVGVSDLAAKAEEMGMKVWTLKKLGEILSRIAPVELAAADSLRTLLEDERVNGTRERDLSAPRADHYYFKPGHKYTLIEDATGRYRHIMVKEYLPAGKDGPDWPVLYESFLRISSANTTDTPAEKLRDRAWSLYVDREPFEDERPPGELRRSTSMRNVSGTPRLPDAAPYQNASGNSVVITSNIASTSCANLSPFQTGLPGLGSAKDRAIMQMSKRVQVLKGNARIAAAKRAPLQANDLFAPPTRSSSSAPLQPKTFMTQDQVIKMLRQARQPVKEESISFEMRVANKQKVYGQGRPEQDTAGGYCENCRLRYSDLSIHLASKKHRRFAQNDQNFAELDTLLGALRRPLRADLVSSDFPPCNMAHERTAYCDDCENVVPTDSGDDQDDAGDEEALDYDETDGDIGEESGQDESETDQWDGGD